MAGFKVIGVDVKKQPRYIGDEFVEGDAVAFIKLHGHEFDFIHASPPCQKYSWTQRIQGNDHPDLIGPTREALIGSGVPFVLENVAGAPLVAPIELCGAMFGLRTYRHRIFECGNGFSFEAPIHPRHTVPVTKMGRAPVEGEFMHIVGNFIGVEEGKKVMEMPWATRPGLREAIPPAYTEYIGQWFVKGKLG